MKLLITLILIALSINFSYGQNYSPIIYENSGWNEVGWELDNLQLPIMEDLYKSYFFGDTTINSLQYHKYYYDLERYFNINPTYLDSNHYVGAMRNSGSLYYFIPKDSTTERLIYDFSLTVGDTVPVGFYPFQNYVKTIYDTTTITLLDNSTRIKFSYQYLDSLGNPFTGGYYIDGIGDGRSLVYSGLYIIQPYNGDIETYSYCENGNLLYKNGIFYPGDNCDFTLSVFLNSQTFSNTTYYPNPTSGNITIDLGEVKQEVKATLNNSLGQVILTQQFESTDFIHLNIDAPIGIYFLQLESNGEAITKKIIKE